MIDQVAGRIAEQGGRALAIQADVTDRTAVRRMAEQVSSCEGNQTEQKYVSIHRKKFFNGWSKRLVRSLAQWTSW